MTKRYTDADVARLVGEVQALIRDAESDTTDNREYPFVRPGYYYHGRLSVALGPFLPDPDEDLVKKMTEAFYKACWPDARMTYPNNVTDGIGAALAVVKREGLPT